MMVETLIIGSGVAAAAAAQRLLEHDPFASILMLEAGPRVKTKDFGLWTNFLITRDVPYKPYLDLPFPAQDREGENANTGIATAEMMDARVMAYGGSTHHWGGWAFRMKPEDFQQATLSRVGMDWPFKYDSLEPYYGEAEHYLAVSGDSDDRIVPRSCKFPFAHFPLTLQDKEFVKAFDALGISYGHLPIARRGLSAEPSRHAPCQTTGTCKYCPFGARYVASNYLDDFRSWNDLPNFELRLGAVVEEIILEDSHRVSGARYINKDTGEVITVEADRVIIAAGAVESAKLLLRSTSTDYPNGLGNQGDMVGRNLVTHPFFRFKGILKANPRALQAEMDFPTLVSRHFDSQTEQAEGKFVLVVPAEAVKNDFRDKMRAGKTRAAINDSLTGPAELQLHGMFEIFGRSRNRVKNLCGRNRVGLHQTEVSMTPDENHLARMAEIGAAVGTIYHQMGASTPGAPSISWRIDHASGTCRMSDDPGSGVVDSDLRVHGIDNLYICSNAVMPNLGAVNPTLTLAALALRLGDTLAATSRAFGSDQAVRQRA
jgi:choline dehydrogenase-like flavoprotein